MGLFQTRYNLSIILKDWKIMINVINVFATISFQQLNCNVKVKMKLNIGNLKFWIIIKHASKWLIHHLMALQFRWLFFIEFISLSQIIKDKEE